MSQAEVERGLKADKLINDPTLVEAFEIVKAAILARIEDAPIRDRDGVHELKLMLKLLRDVRSNLEQAVKVGKLAQFRIQEADEAKKRRFKLFG